MDNSVEKYQGVWWVPEGQRFSGNRFVGILSCAQGEFSLEIIHDKTEGLIARFYNHYDVVWGKDAAGTYISLFNVNLITSHNFSKAEFKAEYVLVGVHIASFNERCFGSCVCSFPYLINWAFESCWSLGQIDLDKTVVCFDLAKKPPILSFDFDEDIDIYLWPFLQYKFDRYDLTATQKTTLNLEAEEKFSISKCLEIINEFKQFFSLLLYCRQRPNEIKFKLDKKDQFYIRFLFRVEESVDPMRLGLIDFEHFKEAIPGIFKKWHTQYHQMAPIVNYLLQSIHYDSEFDIPDFLIVAQALDGYFKRFVNKKDGKDIRQYKRQIEVLLDYFEDIEAIQKCNIDADVLAQSRNKYSHLLPDEEEKVSLAVTGEELFDLTQKSKILLTCCILDSLGLSKDDINYCCKHSRISFMLDRFSF